MSAMVPLCRYMIADVKDFDPIEFIVRDENRGKLPVFKVMVTSGVGFVFQQVIVVYYVLEHIRRT